MKLQIKIPGETLQNNIKVRIMFARDIQNFPKVTIEIKPSTIIKEEIGVFAVCDISKNSVIAKAEIFETKVVKFNWNQVNQFDDITRKKIMDYGLGEINGVTIIDNLNYLSIPWNMNHGCDYNVGFGEHDDFIAKRNIRKGEELLWDYGLAETNPKFKMMCKCRSPICRKIITGNDWKNSEFRKKNIDYMLNALRK